MLISPRRSMVSSFYKGWDKGSKGLDGLFLERQQGAFYLEIILTNLLWCAYSLLFFVHCSTCVLDRAKSSENMSYTMHALNLEGAEVLLTPFIHACICLVFLLMLLYFFLLSLLCRGALCKMRNSRNRLKSVILRWFLPYQCHLFLWGCQGNCHK